MKIISIYALLTISIVLGGFGLFEGIFGFARLQERWNSENDVLVTEVRIRNTQQLVEVEKQRALIRVTEAHGISDSQQIIASSLTLNYLQYLAIQAQEKMAGSPNHTQIYIPSGNNGIPLVKTVGE